MKWLQVEIRVSEKRDLELCLAALWELGTLGVEEHEEDLTLRAFFEPDLEEHFLQEQLDQSSSLSGGLCWVEFKRIEYDSSAWIEAYRKTFEGFSVSPRIYVHPSWDQPSDTHEINLLIDPGHGFGTGTHESTRLCLQALTEEEFSPRRILDVGTGSGILAVAAARLFPEARVVAIDTDMLAITAAQKSFQKNGVSDIQIFNGSVDAMAGKYDLVVANLTAPILRALSSDLERLSAASLLISGFTTDQQASVVETFRAKAMKRWTLNGWVCALLQSMASAA